MVGIDRIHELLNDPGQVGIDDIPLLKETLEEYPYFQSIRSVYLKALHDQQSAVYNKELSKTAAITADRSVLFDFITSDVFLQNRVSNEIKLQNEGLYEIEVTEEEIKVRVNDLNADTDFNQVANEDLFEKKELANEKIKEFGETEKHSFHEWLALTQLKPIQRDEEDIGTMAVEPVEIDPEKLDKMRRIDEFLKSKPKIKPRKKAPAVVPNVMHAHADNQLMTETLAKVYLSQENYEKAIKSYEILVLQHPEKSGFFADRIREIKNLQSKS